MNDQWHTALALRHLSELLGPPTHLLLLLAAVVALFELGVFVRERFGALPEPADARALLALARARVDRADILARVGPMLGLMGTLIPLGPGLSALGRGDVATLASAVTVAFDTTVLGLAVGVLGFCLSRGRRSHYDRQLDAVERAHG